jgi:hypothetical protein
MNKIIKDFKNNTKLLYTKMRIKNVNNLLVTLKKYIMLLMKISIGFNCGQ